MTGQVRALNYLKECRGGARYRARPGLKPSGPDGGQEQRRRQAGYNV